MFNPRHLAVVGLLAAGISWGCSSPAPPSCTYTASVTSVALPPGGGSGSLVVTTGQSCGWTASTTANWLTITSGGSGTGTATVAFGATANGPQARTATLSIASLTITVSQAALPVPTYALSGQVSDSFIGPAVGLTGVSVMVDGPSPGAAVTDASGRYTIGDLLAGVYSVTFSRAAYTTAMMNVQIPATTSLPATLSLADVGGPSTGNLTGYWSGTGTYPNAPFKLALIQEGDMFRGIYADQHDQSSDVSGTYGTPEFTLRVNFGDAILLLQCEIEDAVEVSGVQRTSALGNRPYPFTMTR